MAQPSVAREPSMEEILASIRRIIESNDPAGENGQGGSRLNPSSLGASDVDGYESEPGYIEEEIDLDDIGFGPDMPANDPGAPHGMPTPFGMNAGAASFQPASQQSSAVASVHSLSAAQAEFQARQPSPAPQLHAVPPVDAPAADRSLSLADVAARVRAASARQQESAAHRHSPAPQAVASQPSHSASSHSPSSASEPSAGAPLSSSFMDAPLRQTIAPDVSGRAAEEPVDRLGERPASAAMERQVERVPSSAETPAPKPKTSVSYGAGELRAEPPALRSAVAGPSAPAAPAAREVPPVLPEAPRAETHAARELPQLAPAFSQPVPSQPAAPLAEMPRAAEPASLPQKIEAAANLMSVEAGAHVARSFEALTTAIDGFDRRSVEEMAQEMLRPMLQEWLDDNLPTLVERLVREEIERVARGPRR